MIDNERMLTQIAQIFNQNIGNRLTVQLANGMLSEIQALVVKNQPQEVDDVHNSATDASSTESGDSSEGNDQRSSRSW